MEKIIIDKTTTKVKGRSKMSFDKQTGKVSLQDIGISYAHSQGEGYIAKISTSWEKEKMIESLNLASALNTTTAPANIMPNPETILSVPFRMISATMVGAGTYKATDFTDERMLKDSLPLLLGQTVYGDHESCTENWLGKVARVAWTTGFNQNGMPIPSGIDAVLDIETSTDRGSDLAKGIMLDALVSNSVSVEFEWDFSHPCNSETEMWDMIYRIGDIAPDGRMYCRKVTKILGYDETSIVSMGADPYAKKIDANGNLIMVDKSGAAMAQSAITAMEAQARVSFFKEVLAQKISVLPDEASRTMLLSLSKRFDAPMMPKVEVAPQEEIIKSALSTLMESSIARLLETKAHDSRASVISAMADVCECTPRTIRNYLNGVTKCPAQGMLVAMAGVLLTAQTDLIAAAAQDGCTYAEPIVAIPQLFDKEQKNDGGEDDEEEEIEEMEATKSEIAMEVELKEVKQAFASTSRSLELSNEKLTSMEVEKTSLQAALSLAKAEIEANKGLISFAMDTMEDYRKEALRFYNAALGEDISPAMLKLIEGTKDAQFLKETIKSFGKKTGLQFDFHCKECGSKELSFGSVKEVQPLQNVSPKPNDFPSKSWERERK